MGIAPQPEHSAQAADPEIKALATTKEEEANEGRTAVLPIQIQDALKTVPDEKSRALLSIALSRTTFGFGPDAETMKVLVQTEMHEEDCKLKAYQASLQNREEQSKRDHDFRKKRLNHQTMLTLTLLTVLIGGIGGGLFLSATGNTTLGNPVLIASFTMLTTIAGKLLATRDKE